LGGRKGIRPVKNLSGGVLAWLSADLHMAQLMPLPLTVFCFCKTQIGFTFLVPAYLGSPGKRAVKQVCVCEEMEFAFTTNQPCKTVDFSVNTASYMATPFSAL